ncbi:hypothetical protein GCM10028805_63280 [Spirosoma harenae]
MRPINQLVIALLLVLLNCTGPVSSLVSPVPAAYSTNYWGDISGTRQGVALQNPRISASSRVPCTQHSFDITITEFDDEGEKLTTLTLQNIPKRACNLAKFKADYGSLYCDTDTIGSTFTTRNEKMPWGTYKPVINAETRLSIQSFDTLTGEIRGTFSVRMIPDIQEDPSAPALLQIKNGKFLTKLKGSNGTYKL